MKRMVVVAVVAGLFGAGGALAGNLPGMQAWAARAGTNEVARQLSACGLTNAADRAVLVAGWDEDVFLDQALRTRTYSAITFAMGRDRFAPVNVDRIKAAMVAETVPPPDLLDLVLKFPVAERAPFQTVAEAAGAVRYCKQPEYGRLMVKYAVLRGVAVTGAEVPEEDLLGYLFAPETMGLANVENCKKAIKERAVALARVKLRAEGKTFVVKNGVNPLVTMAQPVVSALNAQECAGLEAALRNLGSAVEDLDRKAMRDLVAGWQPRIMSGEMGPGEVNQVLGKVAVALGPDEYNRFVDAYNNGTAGGK